MIDLNKSDSHSEYSVYLIIHQIFLRGEEVEEKDVEVKDIRPGVAW